MVVGDGRVTGGKTRIQGGGHVAVGLVHTRGSSVTVTKPVSEPSSPPVLFPHTSGQ